jgi:hypothetical protein
MIVVALCCASGGGPQRGKTEAACRRVPILAVLAPLLRVHL